MSDLGSPAPMDTEDWALDPDQQGESGLANLTPVGPTKRPNGQTYYPRTLGRYEDIAFMRHARAEREHVLFEGPPGTGKSALSEAAFPEVNGEVGFETLFCTADTTEADIVGGYIQNPHDPTTFVWANGPFLRSLNRGVPFIIEEIALADPRVLSVIYPAMDGRSYVEVPSNPALGKIPVPDGWNVVASYNPDVPGANMSEALLDRFDHTIEVTTDWDLAAFLKVDEAMIRAARELDQRRRMREIAWSPQLRSLLSYKRNKESYGQQYALENLIAKTPAMYRDTVASVLDPIFKGKAMNRSKDGVQPRVLALGKQFR